MEDYQMDAEFALPENDAPQNNNTWKM